MVPLNRFAHITHKTQRAERDLHFDVDNIPGSDRPAMVRALAASDPVGSHFVTTTAGGFVGPFEWNGYPRARDVRI